MQCLPWPSRKKNGCRWEDVAGLKTLHLVEIELNLVTRNDAALGFLFLFVLFGLLSPAPPLLSIAVTA